MAKKTTKPQASKTRLPVPKTYKLYVGGKFPRTESGRYLAIRQPGFPVVNVCRASRKDFRNAMVAARAAQGPWSERTAYNRSQILYRIAEMLEGRSNQFVEELRRSGKSAAEAIAEVEAACDRLIYFAGWCDKYQQIFSSVNPVASPHFNFSSLEPIGVVTYLADDRHPLLGLVTVLAAALAGGNSLIAIVSETNPLPALSFAEVLHTSDLPGGVVNLLSGQMAELAEPIARHMDLNVIATDLEDPELVAQLQSGAPLNLKRIRLLDSNWQADEAANPYLISQFCEVKTTWHPVEVIGPSGVGY